MRTGKRNSGSYADPYNPCWVVSSVKKYTFLFALMVLLSLPAPRESAPTTIRPSDPEILTHLGSTWIGICQTEPYSVYKLTLKTDGTGYLMIKHPTGELERWTIAQWYFDERNLMITFALNFTQPDQLTGSGVLHTTERLTLTTHWKNRELLPKRTVMLVREEQIKNALKHFQREESETPNKAMDSDKR